jgi:LemA protein
MFASLTTLFILIPTITVIGLGGWCANLVKRKNCVDNALADIDMQFSLRRNMIPGVLATARHYLDHEQALLEKITALRGTVHEPLKGSDARTLGEKFNTENQLSTNLGHLLEMSDGYPELKSDAVIVHAQAIYQEVETRIAASRRYYNSAVNGLRNASLTFPGPLIAPLVGVRQIPPFFEAPTEYESSAGIIGYR